MAEIEDTDEALVIHVTGWDKVWRAHEPADHPPRARGQRGTRR